MLVLLFAGIVVNSSPIPFPDYEGLGMGYFLWGGNTEPCTKFAIDPGVDPGWRVPAVIKLDKNLSAHSNDSRWEIPGNTQCTRVPASVCTFNSNSTIFKGDISYSNNLFQQTQFNDNNEDFINNAAFSGSPTFTHYHGLIYGNNRLLVSANAICPTYIYRFADPNNLQITLEFRTAVNALNPIYFPETDYYPFIEIWGSHFTISLYTGSRYSRIAVFDHNGWNQMNWNKYDIPFVASTAYSVATKSCNNCNQTVINQAKEYSTLAIDAFESAFGLNPVAKALSLFNWMNSSSWYPVPFDYTFLPISMLLTSKYFPNKPEISQIQQNYLKALGTMYSSTLYCPLCSIHQKDTQTPPAITNFSKPVAANGKIDVKCGGSQSVILSCGIKTGAVNGNEFDKFWSVYPKSNTECSGTDKFNATVFTTCSSSTDNNNIQIRRNNFTVSQGHITVECQGYESVSGCGMIPYNSGNNDWDYQKAVYPSSGKACYCRHKFGGECFAVCSEHIIIKETPSTGTKTGGIPSVLTCGKDSHSGDQYYMFACGIELSGTTVPTKLTPQFYVNNYDQCVGYSQQEYALWATCGTFAS